MSGTGIDISPDMDPEAVLAHYGVKGMRWGHTTADGSSGGSGGGAAKAKPTSDDVKLARRNIRDQKEGISDAKKWAKANTAKGSAERILADKKVSEMKVDLLNNPDRITALRATKGEKIILTALAVTPGGAPGILGNVAVRAAQRNSIAKKQATGAYGK